MRSRFVPAILFAVLAACGGVVDPSQNTVETRTGTIPVGGTSDIQQFTVSKSGEISIKVTNLTPTVPLGTLLYFAWGQVISGQCSLFGSVGITTVGATPVSTAITPGTYCVY